MADSEATKLCRDYQEIKIQEQIQQLAVRDRHRLRTALNSDAYLSLTQSTRWVPSPGRWWSSLRTIWWIPARQVMTLQSTEL